MTNLALTSRCNLACSYCFARPVLPPDKSVPRDMSWDIFERALGFLEQSGQEQACFLGGEPTLHPDFPDMVDAALSRGFRLLVFTNGKMPDKSLEALTRVSPDRLTVLVNLTRFMGKRNPDRDASNALQRLGPRAMLGLNLFSSKFTFGAWPELIRELGLRPFIRIGLAHPSLAGEHDYLVPGEYGRVGRKLETEAEILAEKGVRLELDCGFTPCMFPNEGSVFGQANESPLGLRCNPLPDILPDGSVISCFSLAALGGHPLDEARDAREFREIFFNKLEPYKELGIYPECRSCGFREQGKCLGGCRAAALGRLRRGPFKMDVGPPKDFVFVAAGGADKDEKSADLGPRPEISIPFIDQPMSFWREIAVQRGPVVRDVYFPLPGDLIGSGRPELSSNHLSVFLRESDLPKAVLLNPIVLPRPVEELAPLIIAALERLIKDHGVSGAVVANPALALAVKDAFPDLSLTASTLMDVARPNQVLFLNGLCDALVPSSRIMRSPAAIKTLKSCFSGRIRLLVNECCLPDCLFRTQHFFEMCSFPEPRSLCDEMLERKPWLRLTGSFVLPQHLHLFDGCYDELKLAGRVSLQKPGDYFRTLNAYLDRTPLSPDRIGGGPAAPSFSLEIEQDFYAATLDCDRRCQECSICRDYYERKAGL